MANFIFQHVFNVASAYNYPINMMHNQRIIGPRALDPIPDEGCEIFLSNLPRNMFEDELLPFFNRVGNIYKLRLMLCQSGLTNRGFGYVTYKSKDEADLAVRVLNNVEIRPGKHIVLEKSRDNRRIFVGGIPDCKTKGEVYHELQQSGMKGIVDVIMYTSYTDPNMNRGFVFVEFASHQEAAAARNEFRNVFIFGQRVRVDWSTPLHEVTSDVLQKVKKLYLRNLSVDLSKEELADIVRKVVRKITVEKVYKFRDYAFVHFSSRKDAQQAMLLFNDYFKNSNVQVLWAKPPPPKVVLSAEMLSQEDHNNNNYPSGSDSLYSSILNPSSSTRSPLQSSSSFEDNFGSPLTNISLEDCYCSTQNLPPPLPYTLGDLLKFVTDYVQNSEDNKSG